MGATAIVEVFTEHRLPSGWRPGFNAAVHTEPGHCAGYQDATEGLLGGNGPEEEVIFDVA